MAAPGPAHGGRTTGRLDLVASSPPFRYALRGYDRLQVDEHLSCTERELALREAMIDRLIHRLGAVTAQRDGLRAELDRDLRARETVAGLHRLGEILVLAAEDAAQVREDASRAAATERAHAREEADLIEADARAVEADAWALRAEALREHARASADRRAAEVLRETVAADVAAVAERSRAAAQQAAEQLARVRAELQDLQDRRDLWRRHLDSAGQQLLDVLVEFDTAEPAAPVPGLAA
jgi:chromosome segregation ATPase